MDRDLALQLLETLTAIKVAVQTIANGGTPPEANPNVQDNNRNAEPESEPETRNGDPEPEPETRSAKTTSTKGGK